MKTLILFFLTAFLTTQIFSQAPKGVITGTVKDTKNDAIGGAKIKLVNARDSTLVMTVLSNDVGRFECNGLQNGEYFMVIVAMGYKRYFSITVKISEAQPKVDLPVMALTPENQVAMKEVTVTAKKPLMEPGIDRTIVNVDAMISAATSSTLEVLEKTPGVTVSSNGEISLNGRSGVMVLIDGRTVYMSGQDLVSYLKSLPGGLLDKIELIDNPSAKYDAGGNAIINIRLKKNKVSGLTGNVSMGYSQGKYPRSNNAINLNYNHKKINLFTNIGYNAEKNYTLDKYHRRFYDEQSNLISSVDLTNYLVSKSNNVNINIGMDYSVSEKTTYGFLINWNNANRNGNFDYASNQYDASHKLELIGTGNSYGEDKRSNLGANLNMLHKFNNSGRELALDLNYMDYRSSGNQYIQNNTYLADGSVDLNEQFHYVLPSDINIYTIKADYIHPLKRNAKFEAGIKSGIVENNSIAQYYTVNGHIETIDYGKSNQFNYKENINAAYVNFQKGWKYFGAQFGLRAENTRAEGKQLGNDSVAANSFTKNYTGLFPSLFLNYKLDSLNNNSLSLILTRRINRPGYQSLNPFIFFRDQYSYTSGNPLLTPQYQSRVEIKYQHKQIFWTGLSYNKFTDVIFQTTQAIADTFITSPQNIGKGFMLLLNMGTVFSPAKFWQVNAVVRLSHMGLNGKSYTEHIDFTTNVARIEIVNYFSINKKLKAELGGYYASNDLNGQTVTSGMYRVYASFQQRILKDKGSIRLAFEDIFHSWVYENRSISLKQAEYFQTNESDTQRIGIAFTYRFGKTTFARKRKHNDDAADEEKGRVM